MNSAIHVRRLGPGDGPLGKRLFAMMAETFGEAAEELSDAHVETLLSDTRFWAVAAFIGNEIVGGITAHTLPMTRTPSSALFVYDVAVRADHQRRGVGRELVRELRAEASRLGISDLFVLADDEDAHALHFYRALGGVASAVTMFDLGSQ